MATKYPDELGQAARAAVHQLANQVSIVLANLEYIKVEFGKKLPADVLVLLGETQVATEAMADHVRTLQGLF